MSENSISTQSNSTQKTSKKTENKILDIKYEFSLANIIQQIINKNKKLNVYYEKLNQQKNSIFNLNEPSVTIQRYLHRIFKYTFIEKSSLIISLIYLDRICKQKIFLTNYNIHKLLIISILLAIKYNEDSIFENKFYAKVFGINLNELNELEYEFINLIDFQFFINELEFNQYLLFFDDYSKKYKLL